jgi:hypothetical protein
MDAQDFYAKEAISPIMEQSEGSIGVISGFSLDIPFMFWGVVSLHINIFQYRRLIVMQIQI